MKKIKSLAILIGLLITIEITAQQDFTLYNMEVVPQRMYANPAFFPSYSKINIGLPLLSSQYLNFSNNGFKYSDLIKHRGDDSLYLDYDNMLSKLAKNNYIAVAYQPDLLSVGFRIKEKNYLSLNITEKVNFRFRYPKNFMEFIWKGNGGLLGEELQFNFGVDFTHYREYGIGYARIINDKLTVGGKIKYLYGMENVSTKKSDITLYTDPTTFDITAKANISINTSGLDDDDTTAFQFSDYAFKKKNHGMGIDLGGVYKLNNKFSLSASIIDLGFIKWKDKTINYTSKNPDASFTYKGIEINDLFNADTTNNPFDTMADTLSEIFKIEESNNAYTTKLSSQFYLGGNYFFTQKSNVGLLFYGQIFDKTIHPGAALSYNQRVGRWLNVSASYSIYNRSYNNLGLGIALNGGPVQLYVVSDNVLGAFLPQNTKNLHVHFGINLTFGRTKTDKDKDGIPDKEDSCVDIAGVKEFKGCPDKDGDHIQDKDDECPDEPGLAANKGCPDRDMDKVLDKVDACPDEPGLPELNGCPDRDGDGLTDKQDECPDEAGTVELKGCPDKDGDGLTDKLDKCPDKAGPVSNNGCPEVKLTLVDSLGNSIQSAIRGEDGMFRFINLPADEKVAFNLEGTDTPINEIMIVVNGQTRKASRDGRDNYFKFVTIKQEATTLKTMEEEDVAIKLDIKEAAVVKKAFNALEFASGKDIILPNSKASLDELAKLLLSKPKWRLKISGHTDNKGSAVSNLKLSQKRAEAVQKYLVSKGVRADRFKVEWFGQARPITDNATEKGRQKNRRVEMLIIE